MKVKDLSYEKRFHMAWRLDHKTACGLLTASKIARLETEWNDKDVYEVFVWAGLTERSAKIHARKVINFEIKV